MRLTLWGMNEYDPTLFDSMVLPDGMDKTTMIDEIMEKSGDLYPYYQVPERLKVMIGHWFERRKYDFTQMYLALTAEYNPIENYDRKENSKRVLSADGSDTNTTTLGTSRTDKHTGADTTHNESQLDTETTTQVSAYDADTFQNANHETVNGSPTNDSTLTYGSELKSVNAGSDTSKTEYGKTDTDVYDSRVHGNIGVTTNQQMIQAEIDLRLRNDLYALIADLFEKEFIVQIY